VRIAVLTSRDFVNSNYRAFPLVALKARGHAVRLELDGDLVPADSLRHEDVVFVYRLNSRPLVRTISQLRERGMPIVWDDDDFPSTPTTRLGAAREQQWRVETKRMLDLAHLVTTPSDGLATYYREELGAEHVRVVENYLPGTYAPPLPRPHEGVRIGWVAAAEHEYDLEHFDVPGVLRRLLDAHPQVRLTSVGVDLRLPRERYRHVGKVQYYDLAKEVAEFDVGLAPLADIPFNRARSNVKLKEYAAAGVPWLASPIGPYEGMGEKQGGRLVADDGWYAALERLVVKEKERRKLAKRGRRWARTQAVEANLDAWEAPLKAAVERARAG
jgi:glycosyltransferase involved in cell wall biosynthesis